MNTSEYIESLWGKAWDKDTMGMRKNTARVQVKAPNTKNKIVIDWFDPSVILFMEIDVSVSVSM